MRAAASLMSSNVSMGQSVALPPDVRKGFAFPSLLLSCFEAMPQGIGAGGAACKTFGLVWRKGEAFPHIERQSRTHQAQSFRALHKLCDTDRLFIHLKDFRKVFADAILNCAHFNFASQQFPHR